MEILPFREVLYMSKKLLLLISLIVIVALAIPLTIYLVRQQQDQRSQAQASTTLALAPSPQTVGIGETFTLTVKIDPGSNLVSFVNLHIQYDSTKFEISESDIKDVTNGKLSRLQARILLRKGFELIIQPEMILHGSLPNRLIL